MQNMVFPGIVNDFRGHLSEYSWNFWSCRLILLGQSSSVSILQNTVISENCGILYLHAKILQFFNTLVFQHFTIKHSLNAFICYIDLPIGRKQWYSLILRQVCICQLRICLLMARCRCFFLLLDVLVVGILLDQHNHRDAGTSSGYIRCRC